MGVTVVLPQVLQSDSGGASRIDIRLGELPPAAPAPAAPDRTAPAEGAEGADPGPGPVAAATPAAGATLRAVLDELVRRYPGLDRRIRDDQGRLRRYVNVFVDSEECRAISGLDTPVPDGAEVRVLPSVAGG